MAFVIFLLEPCARRQVRTVRLKLFPNVLYPFKDDILKAVYWYLHVNLISRTNDDHYHSGLMPSADGCYVY